MHQQPEAVGNGVDDVPGGYHKHHDASPGNPDIVWLRAHTTVPK